MFTPVKIAVSSLIASAEYNVACKVLAVTFANGAKWQYKQVPQCVADVLANAPSPGAFFNVAIKPVFKGVQIG